MMEKDAKIYVAGHRGMVGSAIMRELERQGYHNLVLRTHKELDLTRQDQVEAFFAQEKPDDYVIATGVQHTVREFTTLAFANDGIELEWKGSGLDEKGYDKKTGKMLVCVNPKWFRPTDVDNLWGDPTKARTKLGWDPQKTSYEELVRIMAEHDRELARRVKAAK